jgi:hypothetical protein
LPLAFDLCLLDLLEQLMLVLKELIEGFIHFLNGSLIGCGDVLIDECRFIDLDEVVRNFPEVRILLLDLLGPLLLLVFAGEGVLSLLFLFFLS